MVPEALAQLPNWLENILLSPVTSAGMTAVLLDLTLPRMTDTSPHQALSQTTSASFGVSSCANALADIDAIVPIPMPMASARARGDKANVVCFMASSYFIFLLLY